MGYLTIPEVLLGLFVICCSVVANKPPSLSGKVLSRQIVQVGVNHRILCSATSLDPGLTQWKKNGRALNPGWDRFKVSSKGDLKIKDVHLSDAGVYTCVATNGYGSMHINYTVVVIDQENNVFQEADKVIKQSPGEDIYKEGSKPVFEEIAKMREMMVFKRPRGSTLKLNCKATGNPLPEINWFKGTEPLMHQRHPHSRLKIDRVTGQDSGRYTCVASNRLGQTNFTYNVQIIDEINQAPKLIALQPANQTVFVGDTASFQCKIESMVEPEVQWLKTVDLSKTKPNPNIRLISYKEQTLMVLKDAGTMHARPDGSYLNKLVIKPVKPQDAGMYVCYAMNRQGDASGHAFLQIQRVVTKDGRVSIYTGLESLQDVSSPDSESSSDSLEDNLPLLIGVPACVILIIILITVFLLQRNNSCNKQSQSNSNSNKVPRTPVPPAEREAYYYSNVQQHHLQQSVNPLLVSRDLLPKTPTPSVDMTGSEFSSVSRSHHHPHHYHYPHSNHNYGY